MKLEENSKNKCYNVLNIRNHLFLTQTAESPEFIKAIRSEPAFNLNIT